MDSCVAWSVILFLAGCQSSKATAPPSGKATAVPADTGARQGSAAPTSTAEKALVDGHQIELTENRITVTTSRRDLRVFDLKSTAPCRLHRDPRGNVRTLTAARPKVVLIECTTETMRSADGKRRLCDTKIHGLVFGADGPSLAGRTQSVGMCPPFQWDDHMFTFFAKDL
jgi:hypothetical protein